MFSRGKNLGRISFLSKISPDNSDGPGTIFIKSHFLFLDGRQLFASGFLWRFFIEEGKNLKPTRVMPGVFRPREKRGKIWSRPADS